VISNRLEKQWCDDLASHGADWAEAKIAFADVCTHYTAPGRHYHTLRHIDQVLQTVTDIGSHARHLPAVRLAAWLHDVIYDSTRHDNEERSADYALALCERLRIPHGMRTAELILSTKGHHAGGDVDAQVLLDADLAILGAEETDYRQYAGQIRQEYAWVAEADYRAGRRRVLESFLARPVIYHLLTERELPARRNLAAEIQSLR